MTTLEIVLGLCALLACVLAQGDLLSRRRWVDQAAVVGLDLWIATAVVVALVDRRLFEDWMQEDGPVEWATFFAFALAGALGVWAGAMDRRRSPLERLGFILVGLFCLAVAGEEISWGQRLLAFRPPELFLERNAQQELNVHNLLKGSSVGGFKLDSRYLVALVATLYGIVAPWLAPVVRRVWLGGEAIAKVAPPRWLSPWFGLVIWVSLTYPVHLAGEAAELTLGLLFLWPMIRSEQTRGSPTGQLLALVAPLVIGVVFPPIVDAFISSGQEQKVAQARGELEALRSRIARSSSKLTDDNVHKRVFTAVSQGYLSLGPGEAALDERTRYFLDPWNNPYWLLTSESGALLYSFGPNRRRDSEVDDGSFEARGDDLMIELTRPQSLRSAAAQ